MSLGTLKVGQKIELVARHRLGEEVAITARARKVFDRVLPEISFADWFIYSDGWTVHAEDDEPTPSMGSGSSTAPQEAGCSV